MGLIFIEIEESIKKIKKILSGWNTILTDIQKKRYSRQIISPEIGIEGQEKISQTRVLQIGAGGLGSPFALYLTAAGIKELTIIDNDYNIEMYEPVKTKWYALFKMSKIA